jgi:hypothetical protein
MWGAVNDSHIIQNGPPRIMNSGTRYCSSFPWSLVGWMSSRRLFAGLLLTANCTLIAAAISFASTKKSSYASSKLLRGLEPRIARLQWGA